MECPRKQNGQIYKVGRDPTKPGGCENVIHAPVEAVGWYSLTVNEDGSFVYRPVKVE